MAALLDPRSLLFTAAGLGFGAFSAAWLLCPRRSAARPPESFDSDELRRRRVARLAAPGDLSDDWQGCFFDGSLGEALRTWRAQRFPCGSLLMLLLEDDAITSLRLRKTLWPVAAPGLLSAAPKSPEQLFAVRVRAAEDLQLAQKLFNINTHMALPQALFLWGSTSVRVVRFGEYIDADAFRRTVVEMRRLAEEDWREAGWPCIASAGTASRVVNLEELKKRSAYEELHRRMAENLLGSISQLQAQALVKRGFANPRDFVVEDTAVGLDADSVAEATREEHLAERHERDTLRVSQEEEFAEAAAADAAAAAAAEAKRVAASQEAEDIEAKAIWSLAVREALLEKLPLEPASDAPGAMHLTVVLPGGRRLTRRWCADDPASAVAKFALGSATEQELPGETPPSLLGGYPPRVLIAPDIASSLRELGLQVREVLRAHRAKELDANS